MHWLNSRPSGDLNNRVWCDITNGYQTPQSVFTQEPLELWIPLLFWFNKDINFTYDFVPVDSLPTKRARCVLWGKGHWWLPYHGLVRTRVLNFERRMRPNLSGEFEGDRLWVLGLAISGDFVHIPRELWIKYRLPDSVANRWKYRLIDVLFVFLSCARFIAFSKLSAVERLQLLAFISFCFARVLRGRIVSLLGLRNQEIEQSK